MMPAWAKESKLVEVEVESERTERGATKIGKEQTSNPTRTGGRHALAGGRSGQPTSYRGPPVNNRRCWHLRHPTPRTDELTSVSESDTVAPTGIDSFFFLPAMLAPQLVDLVQANNVKQLAARAKGVSKHPQPSTLLMASQRLQPIA